MAEEAKLQSEIIKWLRSKGCKVIKQNASVYGQKGTPDLLFFAQGFYGALEVKAHKNSKKQPLQQENIDWFNENSYGRFVYKENWPEVKAELEQML